jgi:putative protease
MKGLNCSCGDFETEDCPSLRADAVYDDSRLASRKAAASARELGNAIRYAHDRGARAYVTVNIFPHNRDLAEISEHIALLAEIKPDAVILSDGIL